MLGSALTPAARTATSFCMRAPVGTHADAARAATASVTTVPPRFTSGLRTGGPPGGWSGARPRRQFGSARRRGGARDRVSPALLVAEGQARAGQLHAARAYAPVRARRPRPAAARLRGGRRTREA